MTDRYLAEQVFSWFGLIFWSLQLAPQAWKTYRRGTSTGVSVWTMLIWTFAGMFMGVYNIGLNVATALWVQPQIFTFIAAICLLQEFRYQHKWSKIKTTVGFIITCLFFGGLEVGLVIAFKHTQKIDNQGAIRFFGIVPVIFVLGGFLPQYYEIFRDKRAIGVSLVFLAMDFSGSIFSILALAFSDNMDALNLANYIAIACFDMGIVFLYCFFEWYQKRYGQDNDDTSNQTRKEEDGIASEKIINESKLSQNDCEDVRNTKSLA